MRLDDKAVARWMASHVAGFQGPMQSEKLTGGQSNPTYQLQAASGAYILRRKPPGVLLKSAHAVDREFRVQSALVHSDVPVPRMYALCEDEAVIGSFFYVMERVEGCGFEDPRLPDLTPESRTAVFDEMSCVMAAIHSVDIEAVGLGDYGPDGNYFERKLGRWRKQYRASETDVVPDMDALIGWLESNLPEDDGRRSLVHGDYRLDNMLFHPDRPECVAMLDWELSTLGHPFADLAGVIMQWKMPPGDTGRGFAGVDRAQLGIPSDEAFIASYCQRMGIAGIPRFGFYLAFCFFRMAAILQGVLRRALDGNAADPEKGDAWGTMYHSLRQQG